MGPEEPVPSKDMKSPHNSRYFHSRKLGMMKTSDSGINPYHLYLKGQ
jgi:hypothetical protein